MGAGSSSLLRPPAVSIVGVALAVAVLVCSKPAYASGWTARTPDPAPAPSLVQLAPYSSGSSAPFASRAPAAPAVVLAGVSRAVMH